MFLENSRYYDIQQGQARARDGRAVKLVRLRRLPQASGAATQVKAHDRLDLMAHRQYEDPTRFWRIADANTELQARALVGEPGRIILVPKQ